MRPWYLKGTDASSHEAIDLPWIDDFFGHLRLSDKVTLGSTLYLSYFAMCFGRGRRNVGAMCLAKHKRAFFCRLKKYVKDTFKMDQVGKRGPRGYLVELERSGRSVSRPIAVVPDPTGRVIERAPDGKVLVFEIGYLRIMYVNKHCGYSAFASVPIAEGTFVCEYMGKRCTIAVGEMLNQYYTDVEGLPSTMLDIYHGSDKYSIDGHTHESGRRFDDFENSAAYINSQQDLNLKMKIQDKKPKLYAMFDIPAKMELFWDYGCPKGEQPDFFFKRKYVVE